MNQDRAVEAMKILLAELPWEFSDGPPDVKGEGRSSFSVIKKRNVRKVHAALWELQQALDMQDTTTLGE